MTAPVTLFGAQTPAVGSIQPLSTWFGAGVPCKVLLVNFLGGPAHFVFLKYEFSKCFANLFTVSLFHYAKFSLPGMLGTKGQLGRQDRSCLGH